MGRSNKEEREHKKGEKKNINEFVLSPIPLHYFEVLSLIVWSLQKPYADVEALLSCLESPLCRILCLSETWLEDSNKVVMYLLPGYSRIPKSSRTNRKRWVVKKLGRTWWDYRQRFEYKFN